MDLQTDTYYYHPKEKRNYFCVAIDKDPQWCEPDKHGVDEILYAFKRCCGHSKETEEDIKVWISEKQWLSQLKEVK